MKHKLYTLERPEYKWDETIGVVVSADNRAQARAIARGVSGDQSADVWDAADLKIKVIGQTNLPTGIIFRSFNAG